MFCKEIIKYADIIKKQSLKTIKFGGQIIE